MSDQSISLHTAPSCNIEPIGSMHLPLSSLNLLRHFAAESSDQDCRHEDVTRTRKCPGVRSRRRIRSLTRGLYWICCFLLEPGTLTRNSYSAMATVKTVGIVGTGVIGASWTALFLSHGLKVLVADPAPGAADKLSTVSYTHLTLPTKRIV